MVKQRTTKLKSKKEKPKWIKWKTKNRKVIDKNQRNFKKLKSKKPKTEKEKWSVAPLGFRRYVTVVINFTLVQGRFRRVYFGDIVCIT